MVAWRYQPVNRLVARPGMEKLKSEPILGRGALILRFPRVFASFLTHIRLSPIRLRSRHVCLWLPILRNPYALTLHGQLYQLLESPFRFSQSNGQHDSLTPICQVHVAFEIGAESNTIQSHGFARIYPVFRNRRVRLPQWETISQVQEGT